MAVPKKKRSKSKVKYNKIFIFNKINIKMTTKVLKKNHKNYFYSKKITFSL